MTSFMTRFVFWSGVYNVGLASVLTFPPIYRALGLSVPSPLAGQMIGGFLAFTSAVLILAARDLPHRAPIVYWESFLRYGIALLVIPAGLFGDLGLVAVPMGLVDIVIGLFYMFGLTKELRVSHRALFFDRQDWRRPPPEAAAGTSSRQSRI